MEKEIRQLMDKLEDKILQSCNELSELVELYISSFNISKETKKELEQMLKVLK